ncbi:MAG: histidine phosphatase family protein [Actinomycetota bacterium]|nr:histidine phosphatase family protein [Actinomycetota bacterium]
MHNTGDAVAELPPARLWLVRHGSTEWSRSGRHTGRTDIDLDATGREQAKALGERLAEQDFAVVLTSPLKRARQTCELAGLGDVAEVDEQLAEWDYGDYEGRTTAEIRTTRPGWQLFRDGCPHGEVAAAVGARADRVLERLARDPRCRGAEAVCFSHGHLLRVLAARWLGLPPEDAQLVALDTASISILGYEHEWRVVERWNS